MAVSVRRWSRSCVLFTLWRHLYGWQFQYMSSYSVKLTVGRQHSDRKLSFPTPQDSVLLGFCTGSLAAAAVSSSQDLVSFIPAAVHAVVVALYTGLRAAQEAQSIHGNASSPWSLLVLGVSGDQMTTILEGFNSRNVRIFHPGSN